MKATKWTWKRLKAKAKVKTLQARVKTLFQCRPYQDEGVAFSTSYDHTLYEGPTGSGKTAMVIATALVLKQDRGITHVLVGTPFNHIEAGFMEFSDRFKAIKHGRGAGLKMFRMLPEGFIQAARTLGQSRKYISNYFEANNPQHILVCTHQAFQVKLLPKSCKGMALILDEFHHNGARNLSDFVEEFQLRGGLVKGFTATSFRADGRPIILDGMKVLRRPLAIHMMEGFAPARIDYGIVPIEVTHTTVKRFLGEEAPSSEDIPALVQAMLDQYEKDGRPKCVIHVPPLPGGSDPLIQEIIRVFQHKIPSIRVFNAFGVGKEQQANLLRVLGEERDLGACAESQWDVIIGSVRVGEGMDWPHCSAVYVYGLPGSGTKVIQLLGRGTRKKDKTHPHKEVTFLRFFVEVDSKEGNSALKDRHTQDAIGVCCLLGDVAVPGHWHLEKEILSVVDQVFAGDLDRATQLKSELTSDPSFSRENTKKVVKALVKAGAIKEAKPDTTVRELLETLFSVDEGDEDGVATSLMNVLLNGISENDREKARQEREKDTSNGSSPAEPEGNPVFVAIQRGISQGMPLSEIRRQILEDLIEPFKDKTLKEIDLGQWVTQTHLLTGKTMRDVAKTVFDEHEDYYTGPRLTLKGVREDGQHYFTKHGSWPTARTTDPRLQDDTWAKRELAGKFGRRGLPGGLSLKDIFQPNHTPSQVLRWMEKFARTEGCLPHERSGTKHLPVGETWNGLNLALSRGLRGLCEGSSLYLLSKHSGLQGKYRWKGKVKTQSRATPKRKRKGKVKTQSRATPKRKRK